MHECHFEFRALTAKDNRENFCCGSAELDSFFRHYAGQNQFRHYIGTTYILTRKNLISKMLQLTQKIVVPAGIAGTQSPWKGLQTLHPCNLDTGDPCRYDGLAEASC